MPIWRTTSGERHPWLESIMNAGADAPGKNVGGISAGRVPTATEAGRVYAVDDGSWEEFAARVDWPSARDAARAADDEEGFLAILADEWYGLLAGSVRRHAPNRLIFGDKLEGTRDLRRGSIRFSEARRRRLHPVVRLGRKPGGAPR